MHNSTTTKKIIAAIFEDSDKNILIAQRGKKDEIYGKWEFPGGKMEPGETEQECLQRELCEELGIQAKVGPYFCSSFFEYKGTPAEMRAYYVRDFSGSFILHEHLQIKWVQKSELLNYDFPGPDIPIIQELLKAAW